jgi:hypothetical protein
MEAKQVYLRYNQPWFKRTQFPVTMSAGATVHHCQSCTFDRIGLDLERRGRNGSEPVIQPGLGYTALARPRTLLGLSCQDIEERDLKASTSVKAEMLRNGCRAVDSQKKIWHLSRIGLLRGFLVGVPP